MVLQWGKSPFPNHFRSKFWSHVYVWHGYVLNNVCISLSLLVSLKPCHQSSLAQIDPHSLQNCKTKILFMIINSGWQHDFPEMFFGIVFLLIFMPYLVQTAVVELLKDQNSQCNQIGPSESQIKVLPCCVSGITEGRGVTLFSHKHTMKKTWIFISSFQPRSRATQSAQLWPLTERQSRVQLVSLHMGSVAAWPPGFCYPVVLSPCSAQGKLRADGQRDRAAITGHAADVASCRL